jgi:flagellar biogenesis protein FliO
MDANILQSFGILLAAVVVIGGIMMLIKRISQQRIQTKAAVTLNVLSKITLQPKNHLFVVKVSDKVLVLGVTDSSINILTELEPNFEQVINTHSKEEVTDKVLKKVVNTPLSNKSDIDLSFMNFIKSSLKFGR